MKKLNRWARTGILTVLAAMMGFFSVLPAQADVVVRRRGPAPPLIVETRGPRPWRNAVWVPGHWVWRHHRWVWKRGHWRRAWF